MKRLKRCRHERPSGNQSGGLTVDDAGNNCRHCMAIRLPDRVGDLIEKGAITSPDVLPMLFAHDQAQ